VTPSTSPTSATCRARTVELGLGGQLDALDGLIFPAICDVIRNLSGVWQMRFPDKLARYLDVPQNFDMSVGGAFFRHELESLAVDLAARGARPLQPEGLRASIAAYNGNRRRVRALHALREREPWKDPDLGALPRPARRLGAAGRGVRRAARRLPRRGRGGPTSGARWIRRASWWSAPSASSRRSG
jgi:hypothetical protein